MNIVEGLKSDDPEIVYLYADIAIREITVNQVNELLNKKYKIDVRGGYFYLADRKCSCKFKRKLNFTYIK